MSRRRWIVCPALAVLVLGVAAVPAQAGPPSPPSLTATYSADGHAYAHRCNVYTDVTVTGLKKTAALWVRVGSFGSNVKLADVGKSSNGVTRTYALPAADNGSTIDRYELSLYDNRGRLLDSQINENVGVSCTPDFELLSATVATSRWGSVYCDIILSYRVNDTYSATDYDLWNRINDSATRGGMDLTPGTYTDVYMVARENNGGTYSVWLELTDEDSIFAQRGQSNTIHDVVSSCAAS